jgi:hypothetical protein
VVERIDLDRQYGKKPVLRWRSHSSASSACRFVTLGRLGDGRWYAHATRDNGGAYVFDGAQGEQLARRLAADWMAGHDWIALPAAFGADAKPTDGGSWVKRGGEWLPAEDHDVA